ncbi:MAG: hypothetical protein QXW62_02605 [Candidatus Methanomethylicaceae archaeon]|nr:hypothetical protein [Candidatus Verstraetearchaeota archaeon]
MIIKGENGALAISKVGDLNKIFIEYLMKEIELQLNSEDIIAAFGFGNNEKIIKGLEYILFLIKELNLPLIAFPKNRTLSIPIKILISIGKQIELSSKIPPAIDFNPNLLCTTQEFDGIKIIAVKGGVIIEGLDLAKFHIQYRNIFQI